MKFTATCPECESKISFIQIMMSISPLSFKCTKCRSRIHIKEITILLMLSGFAIGIFAIFALQHVVKNGLYYELKAYIPAFLIIIFMEIVRSLIVCNKGKLVTKKKKKKK